VQAQAAGCGEKFCPRSRAGFEMAEVAHVIKYREFPRGGKWRYPSAPEAFSRYVPYFDAERTKLAGAEPMHIFWGMIEHLDEDF
jgi:hypothetical protein